MIGILFWLGGFPQPQQVEAITAGTMAAHVTVLASDSLRDRGTPSPDLERTAQYVASQFQQWGLHPGAGSTKTPSWFQRYPLPGQRRVSLDQASLGFVYTLRTAGRTVVTETGTSLMKLVTARFTSTARFVTEIGPLVIGSRHRPSGDFDPTAGLRTMVVVAGRQTLATLSPDSVRDKVVLYVAPAGEDPTVRRQVLASLYATSLGVVIVSPDDSAHFATAVADALQHPAPVIDDRAVTTNGGDRWAVEVWSGTVRDFLGALGFELGQLRAATTPRMWTVPSTGIWLGPQADESSDAATAPNVIGLLPGSDTALAREYVVFSAPMDRLSSERAGQVAAGSGDRNTAGMAGLLALAHTFSRPGARPRRSLLFLATSGSPEHWGSTYFTGSPSSIWSAWNPSDRRTIVADIALEIGQAIEDTLVIDGMRDSQMEPGVDWVIAMHPELGFAVAEGETAVQRESDRFPFVCQTIPSLSFHTRMHDDSILGRTSSPADAEWAARVFRLVSYVGQAIANADRRPQWTTEGRRQLMLAC